MIDWNDNAKAAAMEFAKYAGQEKRCERYFKYIPPKTKTVADAVAEHKGKWPFSPGIVLMGYSPKHDHFFAFGEGYHFCNGEYQVCTREQFETYVEDNESPKDKGLVAEQEGEKWTHMYLSAKACIKVNEPDMFGRIVVFLDCSGYKLVKQEELKPIKPTISESEAIGILKVNRNLSFAALLEDYDVVKD